MGAMATTNDLKQLIDREMGKGQGPFLVRICQDAGLLPRVKRGGWRAMEDLTVERLADFVIAVAGTRPVGARNANGARAAVDMFAALTCEWEGERGVRTLRDDIAYFLGQYRDRLQIGDGYQLYRILFVSDEHDPEVEIQLIPTEGDDPGRALNYVDSKTEPEPSSVREAVVIQGSLLFELGVLLLAPAPEETDA